MTNLIGRKDVFAIEYRIQTHSPSRMGNVRLWIDRKYLGAYEDVNILSVTLHQLKRLLSDELPDKAFDDSSKASFFRSIKSGEIVDGGKYFLSLGESFDDFFVVAYKRNNSAVILWQLEEKPYFKYSDYPKGVQFAKVPMDELRKVVDEFRRSIKGSAPSSWGSE